MAFHREKLRRKRICIIIHKQRMQAIVPREITEALFNLILIRTNTNTIILQILGWLRLPSVRRARIFQIKTQIPISHQPRIARHKMENEKRNIQQRLQTLWRSIYMRLRVQVFRTKRDQVGQVETATGLDISRNRRDDQLPQEGRKITKHLQYMETELLTIQWRNMGETAILLNCMDQVVMSTLIQKSQWVRSRLLEHIAQKL